MTLLRRLFCRLRGHDLTFAIDGDHGQCLRCVSCDYESPGFHL